MDILHLSLDAVLNFTPKPRSVCISILDPGVEINPLAGYAEVLSLRFHDIDTEDFGRFTQLSLDDARRIVEFVWRYRGFNIVAHCHQGQSRSAAVALYAAWFNGVQLTSETWAYNEMVWKKLMIAHLGCCFRRIDLLGAVRCIREMSMGPAVS